MFPYHVAQICTSGHLITDSYDLFEYERRNYCPKCGSPTITSCPSCGAELRGAVEGVICEVPVDAYCGSCGKPFPWTVKALDAVAACIREEDELDAILAENLIDSLVDIMVETPATNLATIRCKKVLASAGKFTVEAIRQFVIDFGCELAKRSLLP